MAGREPAKYRDDQEDEEEVSEPEKEQSDSEGDYVRIILAPAPAPIRRSALLDARIGRLHADWTVH